ncbi:MAG: hypothetical protein HQL31_12445, partial [Planctomycetes bacterium]|nr:hypothetical protein [Planctomycetota bacterium]
CLASADGGEVSYRRSWGGVQRWGGGRMDFWEDFCKDGRIDDRNPGNTDCPIASLCLSAPIEAGGEHIFNFMIAWHFPNRNTWTPVKHEEACKTENGIERNMNIVGNHYNTRFADAWDVALHCARDQEKLEEETIEFVSTLTRSDLPADIKEAALNNLSTLRTETCFRTPDGLLYGFEGCWPFFGCCYGNCTHVWNYEQATAFLFAPLARGMREVEFAHATSDRGLMSFRVNLPLERAQEMGHAAADGQMGCLIKLYRDWRLCGDDEFLRRLWPYARKALAFCWIEGGWDADRDGVMEGCQHNTMDVEYYGPNPQMGGLYLGALRAAQEMAAHLGETEFAEECRELFEKGSRWMDGNLFNGDYYRHEIRVPEEGAKVAEGLKERISGAVGHQNIYQLGDGCLVDQLVGQYLAHIAGLGYLLDRDHVRKTLLSVLEYNRQNGFHDHFNSQRSFALGGERALVMATYPKGNRPEKPFLYFGEVMTGFEYCVAVHLIQEGFRAEGLRVISDIRERYDGLRRNPFDEAECGHHYARAMASYGAIAAWTGFAYTAHDGRMVFGAVEGSHFWSSGDAWGICRIRREDRGYSLDLEVRGGELSLSTLEIRDVGSVAVDKSRSMPVHIRNED